MQESKQEHGRQSRLPSSKVAENLHDESSPLKTDMFLFQLDCTSYMQSNQKALVFHILFKEYDNYQVLLFIIWFYSIKTHL